MIKIQINNPVQKKQEYANAITDVVAFRISVLKQSLSHLNGAVVDFGTGNFVSFKAVTKKIINIVGGNFNISDSRRGYTNSVTNYLANANNLGIINLKGLIDFCDDMLDHNNQQLSALLVCEAADLLNLNEAILNNYGIGTVDNIAVIKLAFDYENYNRIATPIKSFYRINNFVKFCPYCNKNSEVVSSYELDHFYDKATHPLLSYCMFNLVPSDHTCNTTNKGRIEFNDEYHINPHLSGYIDSFKFCPVGLTPAYEVSRIEVEILEAQGSTMYKKIKGEKLQNDESGDLGNLNVFKIRSKYLTKTHKASKTLKTLQNYDKNIRHIKKHLKSLGGRFNKKAFYLKWYENEFNVRFNPTDFNEKAYSKFIRDIHDHYYSINESRLNTYIIELINDY